jgi:hypothetical protein
VKLKQFEKRNKTHEKQGYAFAKAKLKPFQKEKRPPRNEGAPYS